MRIAIDDIATSLSKLGDDALPKIILINGNEPLLVEEALDKLRLVLRDRGFSERLKYQVETGFDWGKVTGAGQSMSLFSERRLIELRVPKSLGAPGTKALTEFCNQPPQDDILVVIMPALDKRQRSAKWAKLVENTGWVADCYDISPQQFPRWLKMRLQSRALRVENGVVDLLAEQLEGNLLAAAQEIDKIQVLADNGAVTLKLLTESLADQARFDVYTLTDVCLLGDFNRALRIKQRLQMEGVEPVIVVWALVRELRTMAAISSALSRGENQASVFKQFRIWSKREAVVGTALKRLVSREWYQLLQNAAKLDQSIKGQRFSEVGDAWQQIEFLCGGICGINFDFEQIA
jgi:DNA polymerase-3 subunit delta